MIKTTGKVHGPIDGESWAVADGPDLPKVAHCIMLDVDGAVQVRYVSQRIDTLTLVGGVWHPMQIDQIISADATDVHLGYLE